MEDSSFHPRQRTSNHFNMVSSNEPSFTAEISGQINPPLYVINEENNFANYGDIGGAGSNAVNPNLLGSIKKGY